MYLYNYMIVLIITGTYVALYMHYKVHIVHNEGLIQDFWFRREVIVQSTLLMEGSGGMLP